MKEQEKTWFSDSAIRHGEVGLFPVSVLPQNVKFVEKVKELVVGHSESGHHHILTCSKEISVYEHDGLMYLNVPEATKIKHLKEKWGHGENILNPGLYVRKIHQSYSYAKKIMRRVLD